MGFDTYCAMMTKEELDDEVDFTVTEATAFHQWRKYPDLHGWMEELYMKKGGTAPTRVFVVLTSDDLFRLEEAIHEGTLPNTRGFFFGESSGAERDDDMFFISKARQAIADGYTVYYDSWW